MIICHCNCIASEAIERTACALTEADPWCMLTPVLVYRSLGRRPRCGGCLPLAAQIIHDCQARQREGSAGCLLEQATPAEALQDPPADGRCACQASERSGP